MTRLAKSFPSLGKSCVQRQLHDSLQDMAGRPPTLRNPIAIETSPPAPRRDQLQQQENDEEAQHLERQAPGQRQFKHDWRMKHTI